MGNGERNELTMIAKNSGLSIGLGLTLSVFIFFGGRELGKLESSLEAHERLNAVQFEELKQDISEIKGTQAVILKAVTSQSNE